MRRRCHRGPTLFLALLLMASCKWGDSSRPQPSAEPVAAIGSPAGRFVGSEACRSCHAAEFAAGKAHTKHDKPVSCLGCHVPKVVAGVLDQFADHAIDVPVPRNTVKHDIPNACNACHTHEKASPEATVESDTQEQERRERVRLMFSSPRANARAA